MHYAILPLLSLALAGLSNAVPVVQRDVARLSESEPWKLSNIRVIEAKDGTRVHSSVSFDIVDINRGLEFSTNCSYSVSPDSDEDLEKPGWRKCGLKFVDFQYTGDKIEIRRYYKDPAVAGGTNMDTVTCFGNWETSLHPFQQKDGSILKKQDCMEVYCTSMVA